ncbi:MAG: OmpW family outer membrane protein [Humidesulfovibrio sp.]|nr:OmpW family outer membrane protein [Humidesulfovibrio sp.]
MKRFVFASLLILVLLTSKPATAADTTGLYVAPKFTVSQQNQDNTKRFDNLYSPTGPMAPFQSGTRHEEDLVIGGALAIGYDFYPTLSLPVRTELEYAAHAQSSTSSQGVDAKSGFYGGRSIKLSRKIGVSTLFANAFYDFHTDTNFTPYVGAGIGVASLRVKDNFENGAYNLGSAKKTVENFAWNLGAGVAYSFDAHWNVDLGYRYSNFGTVNGATAVSGAGYYSSKAKSDATSHEILLGLRYAF